MVVNESMMALISQTHRQTFPSKLVIDLQPCSLVDLNRFDKEFRPFDATVSSTVKMALGSTPAIACIGIIGQHDNPLHISLFPPHEAEELEMSFLLNSSLDIFDIRLKNKLLDQDLGLLHAVDERMATYGWLTNTGMKFIIAVDMMGRLPAETPANSQMKNLPPVLGLRDSDLKPAFKAIQNAYIELLMNPFYSPETRTPLRTMQATGKGAEITSKKFIAAVQRIGKAWYPGVATV